MGSPKSLDPYHPYVPNSVFSKSGMKSGPSIWWLEDMKIREKELRHPTYEALLRVSMSDCAYSSTRLCWLCVALSASSGSTYTNIIRDREVRGHRNTYWDSDTPRTSETKRFEQRKIRTLSPRTAAWTSWSTKPGKRPWTDKQDAMANFISITLSPARTTKER